MAPKSKPTDKKIPPKTKKTGAGRPSKGASAKGAPAKKNSSKVLITQKDAEASTRRVLMGLSGAAIKNLSKKGGVHALASNVYEPVQEYLENLFRDIHKNIHANPENRDKKQISLRQVLTAINAAHDDDD
jgi:hypothetical protein